MIFAVPILIFCLLAAPGVRLLLLAARTRQAPEIWGGLYFAGAAVGISLRFFGVTIQHDDPALALTVNSIGHVGLASGTAAMAMFTQRVFHPDSRGARLFAGALVLAIAATTTYMFATGAVLVENSYTVVAANAARILPTSWACYESFRYWRSMKKRQELGLADPVVTNRFLLWTLWTGGVTLPPALALGLRALTIAAIGDAPVTEEFAGRYQPIVLPIMRTAFLVIIPTAVVALSLSFFPPRRYLDRVRARAEQAA